MMRQVSLLAAALLLAPPSIAREAATASLAGVRSTLTEVRKSPRLVQVTSRGGESRIVTLEGVGCSEDICSRISVRLQTEPASKDVRINFDRIARIWLGSEGEAHVIFKDGTTRRVTIVPDNRVLYLLDTSGRTQKIHVDQVASLDFVSQIGR